MTGKPVIRSTRIPVDLILREIAAGLSFVQIADAYPRVTEEDVRAAVAFAAEFVAGEGLASV